jgi:hypothetical protein
VAEQVETAELRRLLDERERQAARGLPLAGAGIMLSGIPDELATFPFPYPYGWLFPVLAFAVTVWMGVLAWRALRATP